MLKDTDNVREEEDLYGQFISTHYEITESSHDQVVYADLMARGQSWQNAHPVYKDNKAYPFSALDLKKAMIRFTGRPNANERPPDNKKMLPRNCWKFVRLALTTPPVFLDDDVADR